MGGVGGRLLGLVLLAGVAAACSSTHVAGPGLIVEQSRAAFADQEARPSASLRPDGRLAVVAYGSSGCPTEPVAADARSARHVVVTMRPRRPSGDSVCTADLAATLSVIRLPAVISAPPLTVEFRGEGHGVPRTVTIPG